MRKLFAIQDQQITESTSGEGTIHVYINPDSEERTYLIQQLEIDEHTLNSALDPDELARLEFEHDHFAIIYKRPRNYSGGGNLVFKVASTGMFLFQDKLVIVLNEEIPYFEKRHFRRVANLREVMLKLIYGAIYHFLEHLRAINMIVDELEDKINTSLENRYLINLFALEKSMVYYLNSIHSNTVLIEKMRNYAVRIGLTEDDVQFVEDMMIDNSQCYKQADIYSNILASLMDARASIVGNNLNLLMKLLNVITIGIMVPTFVVSAFSMNVALPFNKYHWFAFWGIMGGAALSVFVFYMIMKKRGW